MNDMQAVLEAAERCEGLFECDIVDIENMSVECVTDLLTLARDRHRLTDPTLLTVDRLVEAGLVYNAVANTAYIGGLCVLLDGWKWFINGQPLQFAPSTVGHLWQLLLRMKEQS